VLKALPWIRRGRRRGKGGGGRRLKGRRGDDGDSIGAETRGSTCFCPEERSVQLPITLREIPHFHYFCVSRGITLGSYVLFKYVLFKVYAPPSLLLSRLDHLLNLILDLLHRRCWDTLGNRW
jgi:hypothetical protein